MILTTVRMIDMRILLINPNYSEPIYEDGSHTTLVPNFPIGLGYVASYIREYGDHEIEVLDASKSATPHLSEDGKNMIYGLTSNEIRQKLEIVRPDVIGISGMYSRHAINIHLAADIYCQFEKEGIIPKIRKPENNKDIMRYYKEIYPFISDVPQRNKYFTSNQLEVIQSEFYSRFLKSRLKTILKNPLKLIRKMMNLESMKYTLKLGMVYSRMAVYSFSRKRQKDMTRRLFLKGHKNAEYTAR